MRELIEKMESERLDANKVFDKLAKDMSSTAGLSKCYSILDEMMKFGGRWDISDLEAEIDGHDWVRVEAPLRYETEYRWAEKIQARCYLIVENHNRTSATFNFIAGWEVEIPEKLDVRIIGLKEASKKEVIGVYDFVEEDGDWEQNWSGVFFSFADKVQPPDDIR